MARVSATRGQPYWNGKKWVEPQDEVTPVVIAGFLFAVLMPLIGFILGLTQINRSKYGLRIVIGSVGFAMLWYSIYTG